MATIPTLTTFTAGEYPTASKLTANTKTAYDFLLNPPSASVERAAALTVTPSTFTPVPFDTEVWDNDAMFTATSTDLTVKTPGLWLLTGRSSIGANSAGNRMLRLLVNGSSVGRVTVLGTPTNSTGLALARYVRLVVNDVITMDLWQSAAGNLTTPTTVEERPALQVTWSGA